MRGCTAVVHPRRWPHGRAAGRPGRGRRRSASRVDERGRTPKLGSQQRFDLSADALRERRSAKTDSLP
jgi:hypothetical protein